MSARYTIYKSQYTSAYTLIEILVALTIVGLLFSFGYVNFRDYARRQALLGLAKQIQGDLRLAQGEALSGQKPADVKCNPPANTLNSYGFKVESANQYTIEAECSAGAVSIKTVDTSADMVITTPSPNPISFKVLGHGTNILDGTNAEIILTQIGTNNTTTVIVTSGGEVK